MGMPVRVHVRGDVARTEAVEDCVQAVFDELRAVDVLFSPYRPDSQVSRIGRCELPVAAAHPLVEEVVELCEAARVLTDGAFDAYRADPARGGHRRFDPTGLVKGWAVERATARLADWTGCDVSINAGGDVAGRVTEGSRAPWRVGVEDPTDPTRLVAVLPLFTGGVATSGTAHRGRHLVRPGDGWPVDEVLSVTVVGPSLLWADVFATAGFVTGRDALG
jgi:thiamine biosynthesis lipoprotein